jgi:hypothetical protein
MVEIETPDAEELGGLVTKPFKFVTGTSTSKTCSFASRWTSLTKI